jgi:hypothetical protein
VIRYGGKYRLIDLDATARIEEDYGDKFSEAYLPPERMQLLLPQRKDGRPQPGQPTMRAAVVHDVWQFGSLSPCEAVSPCLLTAPSR